MKDALVSRFTPRGPVVKDMDASDIANREVSDSGGDSDGGAVPALKW